MDKCKITQIVAAVDDGALSLDDAKMQLVETVLKMDEEWCFRLMIGYLASKNR